MDMSRRGFMKLMAAASAAAAAGFPKVVLPELQKPTHDIEYIPVGNETPIHKKIINGDFTSWSISSQQEFDHMLDGSKRQTFPIYEIYELEFETTSEAVMHKVRDAHLSNDLIMLRLPIKASDIEWREIRVQGFITSATIAVSTEPTIKMSGVMRINGEPEFIT